MTPEKDERQIVDLKNFNWRSLNKYFSSSAASNLNVFLEKLPHTAGQSALVAAGIAWAAGAAIGLYGTVQAKNLSELRASLKDTEALKPSVPKVRDVPIPQTEIKTFATTLAGTYTGLQVRQQGASLAITAPTTSAFGQFREAIGHVQNGGTGWRVTVEKLCVGRECPQNKLEAELKINKVSVEKSE